MALAAGGTQTLETKSIVIATGSDVARLPGIDIDEQTIVSSTGALALPQGAEAHAGDRRRRDRPGAGLGVAAARLARCGVVEFLDRVLPGIDGEVGRTVQRILAKQGMTFKLSSKVTGVARNGAGAPRHDRAGQRRWRPRRTVDADVVLVAIGRVPYTNGLGLEARGRQARQPRRIVVDAHFQTSVPGIYAIGDVIAGPMLAHKAEDEGMAVAEILAGQAGHVNYDVIPNVIYTFPEVASVGKSEEELKAAGVAYRSRQVPLHGQRAAPRSTRPPTASSRSWPTPRPTASWACTSSPPAASEMIAEAAVIMEFGGSAEDLARTCHAHPVADRGGQGGRAGGRQAADPHVKRKGRPGIWPGPHSGGRQA